MVEVAAAVIAGLSLGYGVYSGERAAGAQRQGRRDQQAAQATAEAAAVREAKVGEEEENRARQKTPDLTTLLRDEQRPTRQLVDADRLLLGRPGALGL
jgi:uncharacterized protein HemX